jgi:hypothetical protein
MSAAQAYVYSTTYNNYVKDPAIQEFLVSLVELFTSTRIIDMPDESTKKLIALLKKLFFSNDSNGQIAQNAIYRDFLLDLMKMVTDDILIRSQLELLRDNLTYIEEARITGFIPYSRNSTQFISNSHILQAIQNRLLKNNASANASAHASANPINEVTQRGNSLLLYLNTLRNPQLKMSLGKSKKSVEKHLEKAKPYSRVKKPCPYGRLCYRQKNPAHTAEFSHPGNNTKSMGGKRTSKKVYRHTVKKYR